MDSSEKETKSKKRKKAKLPSTRFNIGNIVAIVVFCLLVVCFIFLIVFNNDENKEEKEKVEKFSSSMLDTYSKARTMDLPDAKQFVLAEVYDNAEEYGGVDGVDFAANYILSLINTDTSGNVDDFIENLKKGTTDVVEEVLNGDLLKSDDSNITRTSLTIKSETVCNDGDIDTKYCVDNLNARVYISDKASNKWAVIVHPFMLSSSLMYNAVGEMYTSQGYNVLAPDLRGFGASSGSVAMGYLESLDVYDWIKDLNANYSRYGVTTAPQAIVVHGISLGGATTLQLATNPDIAAANFGPYTSNLTNLNVKGFIDDCGYTSMTGIITGMLTMGVDTTQLTSILGSLGIEEVDFMSKFSKITGELNIPGFEDFAFTAEELSKLSSVEELAKFQEFTSMLSNLEQQLSQFENNPNVNGGASTVPGMDASQLQDLVSKFSNYDWGSYLPEGSYNQIPSIGQGNVNWGQDVGNVDWSQYIPTYQHKEAEFSNVINGLISKVLMEIIGVGLTEENYDKYSNVFSEGRHFPEGSKVMIIHGTADTTVPHNMADIVANNVQPGVLVHKWDVAGAPHAFIVLGSKKNEYKELIQKYTLCLTDSECVSIN